MGTKKPKISLSNGVIQLDGEPGVVDFQVTRLAVHARQLHNDLAPLFHELAQAADLNLLTQDEIEHAEGRVLAAAGTMSLRTRVKDGHLRASWIPFAFFVDGDEVCSLRASYDSNGAALSGIRLMVDGEYQNTRRKNLAVSVARKVCLSYVKTYLRDTHG